VIDGVDITDLTSLNTENGAMGICMDMFLDHKVQENALGKLSACKKKERHHQAGLAKKAGGARISAGLMAITDGYAIGTECLTWALRTRLENEKKVTAKERAAKLERILLEDTVDLVFGKGPTTAAEKWNNTDLKVIIQWFNLMETRPCPRKGRPSPSVPGNTHTCC
jgi:hypothetical protein